MGYGGCIAVDDYEYKIKRSKVYPTNTGETKVNAGYITKRHVAMYWTTQDYAEQYINAILDTDEWGLVSDPSFTTPWANAGMFNVTVNFEKYETE